MCVYMSERCIDLKLTIRKVYVKYKTILKIRSFMSRKISMFIF